ncbi:MAG TPA: S9 family peptidase [Acidobacteriaceae bacterium]|jgi:dipeptidyl aminopeptidase/acylaminoacyl peptidase|nr:S9 family peptidase [Acidobacteriaceae bacterium]
MTIFRPASAGLVSFALASALCSAGNACAQTTAAAPAHSPRITQLTQALSQGESIRETNLSPDGNYIVWNESGHAGNGIQLATLADPAAAKHVTACAEGTRGMESEAVFSPDSSKLAFFSNCTADHKTAIFLADAAGATPPHQLAALDGYASSLTWSPDGKSLSFIYVEGATRPPSPLAPEKSPSGVIGVEGLEVKRVAAVDVASGHLTQITPAGLYVYEFDWSPDSSKLAYIAAPPPGENNWWVAKLYTQPIAAAPTAVLDTQTVAGPLHGLQIAVPRWSPDGSRIAFIGGLMSDQGSTGGDIYTIPSTGGEPTDQTPDRAGSPAWFVWLDNASIGIAEVQGGSSHLFAYDLSAHQDSPDFSLTLPDSVGAGGLEMRIATSSAANTIAFIKSSFSDPPEVWAGDLMNLKQITHFNDALKPLWGKAESIDWTNEGFHVQGWLLQPAHFDPTKKYPLVVYVHGGPSAANMPRWPYAGFGAVPFSALDYFVLMPNPRGSYGQGEKFTQANRKDFGYGDLRDILAGVDAVEKQYPVDDHRVGITGWSYGGFMTMFAVTQTHRFRAAVSGAGLSDWLSYYGENSIDQWMIPFFGASVYDDPAVYAKSSAINYIRNVKTPTLIVVGDRDGECPAPQSFEFWHALHDLGVPNQFVVYPDEGHGFTNPDHRRDVLDRALGWFEQYMPDDQGSGHTAQTSVRTPRTGESSSGGSR